MIQAQLSVYLGPHTARNALRTFSAKALGVEPEQVTREDVPRLLKALHPVLRTLLGAARGDLLIERLTQELA